MESGIRNQLLSSTWIDPYGWAHISLGLLATTFGTVSLYLLLRTRSAFRTSLGICLVNTVANQMIYVLVHSAFVIPAVIAHRWLWKLEVCQISGILLSYLERNILASLAVLSIERYGFLVQENSRTTVLLLVLLTWLHNLAWALPPLVGWGRFERKTFTCSLVLVPNELNMSDLTFSTMHCIATLILPGFLIFHALNKSKAVLRSSRRSGVAEIRRLPGFKITWAMAIAAVALTSLSMLFQLVDWSPDAFRMSNDYTLEHVQLLLSQSICLISPVVYWKQIANPRDQDRNRRRPRVTFVDEDGGQGVPLQESTKSRISYPGKPHVSRF